MNRLHPATKERLPYVLALVALAPSLAPALDAQDWPLLTLTILLMVLNGVGIAAHRRFPVSLPVVVSLLNSPTCFYLSWSFARAGKQWIQYAYLVPGVLFLGVAFYLAVKKRVQATESTDSAVRASIEAID